MRSLLAPSAPTLSKLPALAKVTVPMSVAMVPMLEPLPLASNTSELDAPPAVPLRLPTVSTLACPPPSCSVAPSDSTASLKLIAPPELDTRRVSAVTAAAPLPARFSAPDVTVKLPARFLAEAAVALRPPPKLKTALALLPRMSVPVWAKTVLPARLLDKPVMARL